MVCHPTTHDTWRPTIPSPKARALPSSTTGTTDTGHPACSALPSTVCATTGTTATAHPACRALPGAVCATTTGTTYTGHRACRALPSAICVDR